jgi:hypothetical protein
LKNVAKDVSIVKHLSIKNSVSLTITVLAICFAFICNGDSRAQNSHDNLNPKYSDGEIISVPFTKTRVKIDVAGFELTHDRNITSADLLTAGHAERRVVLKITYDTLFEDIEPLAEEYEKLWWYFYTQDSSLDIGQRRNWTVGDQYWSTHTLETSYGVPVNEKHYDLFQIYDGRYYHVSMRRPLYQEGDSTFMFKVMSSFELLPDSDTDSDSTSAD